MALNEGREIRIGISEQPTFGTRIADGGTFVEQFADLMDINRDIQTHEINQVSGSKNPQFNDTIITPDGAMPEFTLTGPYSSYWSDHLIYSALHSVVEGAGSPFTKTFTPFTIHPDFPSDDPYFLTVMKRFPTASTSWAMQDCIGSQSLKLSCERNGILMLETTLRANGPAELDANPSGTWEKGLDGPAGSDAQASQYGMLFFNDIDTATLTLDGGGAVNLTMRNFSIELTHDVEMVGADGSGGYLTFGISNRKGTATVEILKDTIVESAMASQEADGDALLTLNWGAAGAAVNGELELKAWGKITEGPEMNEDGLIGSVINLDLGAATTATHPLQIIMSNAIDRTWENP